MITPFTAEGAIDWAAFEQLAERAIVAGSAALVAVGTTGESPTLSHAEHAQVIERTIAIARGRVPVIAGTGSNSTAEAIDLTLHAQQVGAAAALVVTPYYNKPSQEALYAHYHALHQATNIPIVLYNVPGRTGVDLLPATVARLAQLPRIVAIKDATGKADRVSAQRALTGERIAVYCGDDAAVAGAMGAGAIGCISVSANVMPQRCAQAVAAFLAGDFARGCQLHEALMPLHDALFCDSNPVPVKYAVSKLGYCTPHLRLPLLAASPQVQNIIDAVLAQLGADA